MDSIVVSFCVPTYNRARYLDSLLESLCQELGDFPYRFEVLVSDNASIDETPGVVERHRSRLPLRCFRQDENRGGSANFQYLQSQALGRYVVYVADDDAIMGIRLAEVIALMEAHPEVGVAYAPWRLLDLVSDQDQGQFYYQDKDVLIPRGEHRLLLEATLNYRAFPEIYVCRRSVLQLVMPRVHDQAFWAFVHAAEFATHAAVLLLKEPFYVFVTNYFADDKRSQLGTVEAEVAWDRYRGGLEYMLGRAAGEITPAQRADFCAQIQQMIAERIAVAVRLRAAARRDPVETYYLAFRLKAVGAEAMLHVPLHVLRSQAALAFLLKDVELNRGIERLVCLGEFPDDLAEEIRSGTTLVVSFHTVAHEVPRLDAATLVFARDAAVRTSLGAGSPARFVTEGALLAKFPG